MANIYQKVRTGGATDNTLILGTREAFYRPINVGTWNEIRLGFLGTMVSGSQFVSSSQGGNPLEHVAFSSNTDRVYVGLKDNGANAPGTTGTNFVGMLTGTAGADLFMANGNSIGETNTQSGPNGSVRMRAGTGVGTTITQGDDLGSSTTGIPMSVNSLAESGLNYNFFYGLKIVATNRGLSNQGFLCSVRAVNWTPGIYQQTELKAELLNGSDWVTVNSSQMDWNDGSNARAWPTDFFIYLPFYNSCLRISVMEIVKVS